MHQPSGNPIAAQRRVRSELRRLREAAGQHQKEVADALEWSTSKLIRIETGAVGISSTDLIALLHHYGVDDQARIDELVEINRANRQRPWWDAYRDILTNVGLGTRTFDRGMSLDRFHASLTPGLLQARGYPAALIRSCDSTRPVEGFAHTRLDRQPLLDDSARPELSIVLDEAVLRRSLLSSSPKRSSAKYSTPQWRPTDTELASGMAKRRNAAAKAALDELLTGLATAERTLAEAGVDSRPLAGMLDGLAELEQLLAASDLTTSRDTHHRTARSSSDSVRHSEDALSSHVPRTVRTQESDAPSRSQQPALESPRGGVVISYAHHRTSQTRAGGLAVLLRQLRRRAFSDEDDAARAARRRRDDLRLKALAEAIQTHPFTLTPEDALRGGPASATDAFLTSLFAQSERERVHVRADVSDLDNLVIVLPSAAARRRRAPMQDHQHDLASRSLARRANDLCEMSWQVPVWPYAAARPFVTIRPQPALSSTAAMLSEVFRQIEGASICVIDFTRSLPTTTEPLLPHVWGSDPMGSLLTQHQPTGAALGSQHDCHRCPPTMLNSAFDAYTAVRRTHSEFSALSTSLLRLQGTAAKAGSTCSYSPPGLCASAIASWPFGRSLAFVAIGNQSGLATNGALSIECLDGLRRAGWYRGPIVPGPACLPDFVPRLASAATDPVLWGAPYGAAHRAIHRTPVRTGRATCSRGRLTRYERSSPSAAAVSEPHLARSTQTTGSPMRQRSSSIRSATNRHTRPIRPDGPPARTETSSARLHLLAETGQNKARLGGARDADTSEPAAASRSRRQRQPSCRPPDSSAQPPAGSLQVRYRRSAWVH
jgi:transcriptional regulator with XRE-family HTH domain